MLTRSRSTSAKGVATGIVLGFVALVVACGGSDGGPVADAGDGGGSDGGGTSQGNDGSPGDGSPGDGGPEDGSPDDGSFADLDASLDARKDPPTSCVKSNVVLAAVTPSGGTPCSWKFDTPFTPGEINLVLTPGWGTVCHAGSSANCGSGASEDGWWFEPGTQEIVVCDRTCERFYEQTQAGKLTVLLGCATKACAH